MSKLASKYSPQFLGEAAAVVGMVTPIRLAKRSEHSHQVALFAWSAIPEVRATFPELEWMFAIPNGGSRGDTAKSRAIEGGKMKAEGVKAGVSDILLPVRRGDWSGLFIEMKKLQDGSVGPSDEQLVFQAFAKEQGYGAMVCYGWQEARDAIICYLTQEW